MSRQGGRSIPRIYPETEVARSGSVKWYVVCRYCVLSPGEPCVFVSVCSPPSALGAARRRRLRCWPSWPCTAARFLWPCTAACFPTRGTGGGTFLQAALTLMAERRSPVRPSGVRHLKAKGSTVLEASILLKYMCFVLSHSEPGLTDTGSLRAEEKHHGERVGYIGVSSVTATGSPPGEPWWSSQVFPPAV